MIHLTSDSRRICRRLRLPAAEFRNPICQSRAGHELARACCRHFSKNEATWYLMPAGLRGPESDTAPESTRWAVVQTAFGTTVWVDSKRNRNVPYLNWDGKRWILNFNWLDNDFNSNDRLVRPRNSLHSPALPGFLFSTPLVQPPSIFPISFNGSDIAAYLELSSTLSSQEICRKNFKRSSFILALLRNGGFCSRDI